MKNLAIMVAAGVAVIVSYCLHAFVPGCIAAAVFVIFFILQHKVNDTAARQWQVKVNETAESLQTGLIDTHLLVVKKLFGYPDVAKQAIEKLIEAASYLGGPPPSRMVIDASYIVEWNKQGLALVAEAKAIVDEQLKARPFAGTLGDSQQQ